MGLQAAVTRAVAGVKLAERNSACSSSADNFDFRIQAKQRRRRVRRKRRPAFCSAGSHVAEIAVFLDAEPARLSPRQRLVVPEAARVEADVAADRPHVAEYRRGNGLRRFGEDGIVLASGWPSVRFLPAWSARRFQFPARFRGCLSVRGCGGCRERVSARKAFGPWRGGGRCLRLGCVWLAWSRRKATASGRVRGLASWKSGRLMHKGFTTEVTE